MTLRVLDFGNEHISNFEKRRKTLELELQLHNEGNLLKMLKFVSQFEDTNRKDIQNAIAELLFDLFIYNDWTYDQVKEKLEFLCK
jgi:hypothetical protein